MEGGQLLSQFLMVKWMGLLHFLNWSFLMKKKNICRELEEAVANIKLYIIPVYPFHVMKLIKDEIWVGNQVEVSWT